MPAPFLMTFLDAINAFLVLAVVVAFARKTRQEALVRAVRWGMAAAVPASGVGAWWISRVDDPPAWERGFAVAMAVAIVGLAAFMWSRRRLLSGGGGADNPTRQRRSVVALFIFSALLLAREGMHTVLLIAIFFVQVPIAELRAGMLLGLAAAAGLAWALAQMAPRLSPAAFAVLAVVVFASAIF